MIKLKIYKNDGTIKFEEADETAVVTFSDKESDDKGAYFAAIADAPQNAFAIATLGIKAIQDNLRSTISTLDNMLGMINLHNSVTSLQLSLEEQKTKTKEPERLVE